MFSFVALVKRSGWTATWRPSKTPAVRSTPWNWHWSRWTCPTTWTSASRRSAPPSIPFSPAKRAGPRSIPSSAVTCAAWCAIHFGSGTRCWARPGESGRGTRVEQIFWRNGRPGSVFLVIFLDHFERSTFILLQHFLLNFLVFILWHQKTFMISRYVQSIECLIDGLIECLIDGLIDWLIDWLNDWLMRWLIDWLMRWLIDWLIGRLIDSCGGWLMRWLIDWLLVWLVRDWLIDWLNIFVFIFRISMRYRWSRPPVEIGRSEPRRSPHLKLHIAWPRRKWRRKGRRKRTTRPRRPMNAFMLFAQQYRVMYTQQYPGRDNRYVQFYRLRTSKNFALIAFRFFLKYIPGK